MKPLSKVIRQQVVARLKARKDSIIRRWYSNQFDPSLIQRYGIVGIHDRGSMERSFLSPLLDLLIAVVGSDEDRYRAVYLDERLRYAPHQADPAVIAKYFSEILPNDEETIMDELGDEASVDSFRGFLDALHAPLRDHCAEDAIRLLAVGDCLLNELRVFLPSRMRQVGIGLDMRCLYFSAVVGRSISTDQVVQFIESSSPHFMAFSFLTYEGLPPYPALLREADRLSPLDEVHRITSLVGTIREFLNRLRERTDATFLVHNVSGLPLTRFRKHLPLPPLSASRKRVIKALNQALRELCSNTPNVLLIDEHEVAVSRGYRACTRPVIPSGIVKGAAFHTSRFGEHLTQPYEEILRSFQDLRKSKVLLVDFDNTLWDGVMADGPVQHRFERQHLLRTLKDAGMLLVALSKNSPENVRWDEMALSPSDFVLLKINWDLKAQSIARAAQELDLGLDSFVLIDDNPAERELIRIELPSVRLLDATDPYTWRSLERLLAFPNTHATDEARTRTEMYRAQAQRREAKSQAFDYPAMMASLKLEACIGQANPRDLDRITELIQRTNQFNTTTIRYSRTDLQTFLQRPDHGIYVAELADKFGKLGLVGVVIVSREGNLETLDSFVMSCRAMGFGLEHVLLRAVMDAEGKTRTFIGRYLQTDRNTPAMGLYKENGFRQESTSSWRFESGMPHPITPDWIRVVNRS